MHSFAYSAMDSCSSERSKVDIADVACSASSKQEEEYRREASRTAPRNVRILVFMVFVMQAAGGLTAPFVSKRQSVNLETAAIMGSIQNAAGLFGALTLGRLSDRFPRNVILGFGLGGVALSVVFIMFCSDGSLAVIIGFAMTHFLCSGISSVINALCGDVCSSMNASAAEAAAWFGLQSLLSSIANIIGPILGPFFISSILQAQLIAVFGYILIIPLIFLLERLERVDTTGKSWTLSEVLNVESARQPAGLWYLSWCFMMVFLFNVCNTLFMSSLTDRFNADVGMYGQLQTASALGGTVGTLVSGPIARRFCCPHPTNLISSFMFITFTARIFQLASTSWSVVLVASFSFAVGGIGIISPIRNSMPSLFIPSEELGGYLGLKQSVESFSGVVGPALAGALGLSLEMNPLAALLLLVYASTPLYAYFGYPMFMQPVIAARTKQKVN